jgi:hypothetical protein
MIVEQRTYLLYPGKVGEYLKRYQETGLAIQRPILGNLIGYFYTEIGPQNQIVHLWAYEDLADRERRRAALRADPRWGPYSASVQALLVTQENKILVPAPFSPYATSVPA